MGKSRAKLSKVQNKASKKKASNQMIDHIFGSKKVGPSRRKKNPFKYKRKQDNDSKYPAVGNKKNWRNKNSNVQNKKYQNPEPSFIHRLPPSKPYEGTVEWMEDFKKHNMLGIQVPKYNTAPTTPLPSSQIEPQALEQLDLELYAFANYVKLNYLEIQLRQHFVQYVEQVAQRLFQDRGCSNSHISVQVFGSFATLAVCTFCSDVDMALWGVVPTFSENSSIAATNTSSSASQKSNQKAAATQTRQAQEPAKETDEEKKRLRLVRWRQALQLIDEENAAGKELDEEDPADQLDGLRAAVASTTNSSNDISDSSSESDYYQEDSHSSSEDDEGPEVQFHNSPLDSNMVATNSGENRLSGRTRAEVVNCLESLNRSIRRSNLVRHTHMIKTARVPIVKMKTSLNFEADLAVGGHTGSDTSLYAYQQSKKFRSFEIVVLFLKMLLHEQEFDQPFTGGLGSYKLYVLVSFHIEEHLRLGGSDRPGEVLVSFFYRYCNNNVSRGNSSDNGKFHPSTRTTLTAFAVVRDSDGHGEIEFSNVFLLDRIVSFFGELWQRLHRALHRRTVSEHDLREPKIPQNLLTMLINKNHVVRLRLTALRAAESNAQFLRESFLQHVAQDGNTKTSSWGSRIPQWQRDQHHQPVWWTNGSHVRDMNTSNSGYLFQVIGNVAFMKTEKGNVIEVSQNQIEPICAKEDDYVLATEGNLKGRVARVIALDEGDFILQDSQGDFHVTKQVNSVCVRNPGSETGATGHHDLTEEELIQGYAHHL